MKKLLTRIAFALALVSIAIPPAPAHAQTKGAMFLQFESLGVAAGAIIQSPVLVLGNSSAGCEELVAVADNSAGGSTRALNVDWLGSDGTTILFRGTATVAIAGRSFITVSRTASAAAAPSGSAVFPAMPGLRMQVTLAAAGAAAGSLAVYCR